MAWLSRQCGSLCVAADEKWSELFDRCYSQLLATTSITAQMPLPTPELTQRVWQNIAATLNNASTSTYRCMVLRGPWKSLNWNVATSRPRKYLKMKLVLESPWKSLKSPGKCSVWSGKFYCVIGRLTSAAVNFCNIAIQLITYLRLDGRIVTAILERSLKSSWKVFAKVLESAWILKPQKKGYPAGKCSSYR